jgi:hypothetical protein
MKYRVAFRDRQGQVHHFRRVYTDLIGVQSAVDDYKIGEPETEFWYEPIESSLDSPSPISNVEHIISQQSLIV